MTGESPAAALVVRRGPDHGRTFEVRATVEIGRDTAADVVLTDRRVSWRHLRLTPGPDGVLAEDLGSTNGTFLDGRRLDGPVEVRPGQALVVGGTELELRPPVAEEGPPPGERRPGRPQAPPPDRKTPRIALVAAPRRRGREVLLIAGVVALSVAVVAVAVRIATSDPALLPGKGDAEKPRGTRSFEDLSREHTERAVRYEQTPPVGGDHYPTPQTSAYYDEPIQPERGVHSLEHGAVWITFDPELSQEDREVLRDLAEDDDHVLVSPFDGVPSPVLASAWGRQVELDGVRDERLEQFVKAYRQGPTAPERTNPCGDH